MEQTKWTVIGSAVHPSLVSIMENEEEKLEQHRPLPISNRYRGNKGVIDRNDNNRNDATNSSSGFQRRSRFRCRLTDIHGDRLRTGKRVSSRTILSVVQNKGFINSRLLFSQSLTLVIRVHENTQNIQDHHTQTSHDCS